MSSGLRSVWPLFVGVLLLYLGHGLQGSLVSINSASLEISSTATGIVMAGFYAGLFISSVLSPGIVGRVGHIRAFAAFASLVSSAILLMPLWHNAIWWFALRVIVGACISGLAIVAESWMNASSSNENRGKMLSVYMMISYSAYGSGQFLLNVTDSNGFIRFILVSVLLSLALVPISLARVQTPSIEMPRTVALKDVFNLSPLAFIATFTAGLSQSVFFTMGPIYGVDNGLSLAEVSMMMAFPSLAMIFTQYPIGSLSDRFDRRIVITALTFLSAVVAAVVLILPGNGAYFMIALLAMFGALSFPVYSLSIAHANDYLESDQMLGASAKLVLIYGVGAIVGPATAGVVMQFAGSGGFIAYLVLVHGGLGFYAVLRMVLRPDTPDETGDYISVAPQATFIAVQAVEEEYEELAAENADE